MADMKLVIVGAAGRMGQTLIRTVHQTSGLCVSAAIEREGAPDIGRDAGELAGLGKIGVEITTDTLEAFSKADGVIDFTVPQATLEFATLSAQARIVHVIGTTGFTEEEEAKLEAASRHATIIKSGNMSLGVNLLATLVQRAAAALSAEDFDIEVLEMHHRHKVDAPSGTAKLLGDAAAKGREVDLADNTVAVRDGITGEREAGTIGFATLRGGSVVGTHSVILAGNGERIELSHIAEDRSLFANGAAKAAKWGKGKGPGLYSMQDVLGL
jgi:4-hydroxy-tetrahydrodipicolinate reductase